MELKKTYKGLVLGLIGFCIVSTGVALLPLSSLVLVRMINNVCTFGVALLAYVIYRTEYVYWYTGTTYEEALKAGSERRKSFALKHFRCFGLFALLFLIFSVVSYFLHMSIWIDIAILLPGITVAALWTIRFKL